jgi:hypothetical protein
MPRCSALRNGTSPGFAAITTSSPEKQDDVVMSATSTTSASNPGRTRRSFVANAVFAWVFVAAVALVAALVVGLLIAGHTRAATTASVEVRLTDVPAGPHRVVITGTHGYRHEATVTTADGSVATDDVPLGRITIDVQGLCQLTTTLSHSGEVAGVNGSNCFV